MPQEFILITGASGLIGRTLTSRVEGQFRIIGLDRLGAAPRGRLAAYYKTDLSSDQSVRESLENFRQQFGGKIASVIHLAAYYDFSGEPSPLYEQVTVRGTERLLTALQQFEVEQFVFSSSMLVHAPCEPGQKINEDWPVDAKWDYPRSKVEAESVIRKVRGNIPVVLARIAGVYDDYGHSIPITNQIQRIYERQLTSRVFPGDTSRGQAFIHLDDLSDAIQRMVERRGELPRELVLLLGEDETPSYDQLQRRLGELLHGAPWETRHIPKMLAKTGAWLEEKIPGEEPFIKPWMIDLADDHYELDINRARQFLGWSPQNRLLETLPKMVKALQDNPAQWYRDHNLKLPSHLK
jgi:nucleoside-diphosphate-sugar epimerase